MIRSLEWAMMPSDWILKEHELRCFAVRDISRALPALKLYITLLAFTRATASGGLGRGEAQLTYSQLAQAAGIARGQVSVALSGLVRLIEVRPGQGRSANIYHVVGFPELGSPGWRRLPTGYVFRQQALEHLSARRATDLAALKCYLLFVALRDKDSGYSSVSHDSIRDYTGVPKNDIRAGISVLLNLKLIDLDSARREGSFGHNIYHVRGLPNRADGHTGEAVDTGAVAQVDNVGFAASR